MSVMPRLLEHPGVVPQAKRRACLRQLMALGLLAQPAAHAAKHGGAQTAPSAGPVVLTVTGRLKPALAVHFNMASLAELPQHDIVASTPWYAQARKFTGPLLRDVMAAAGSDPAASRLRLTALNDYRIEIPVSDVQRYEVIVARLLDGQAMGVRDKGPLFVMYPFDSHAELRSAVHYSRAIWQLRRMEVQ
jgi:hypothetical protein